MSNPSSSYYTAQVYDTLPQSLQEQDAANGYQLWWFIQALVSELDSLSALYFDSIGGGTTVFPVDPAPIAYSPAMLKSSVAETDTSFTLFNTNPTWNQINSASNFPIEIEGERILVPGYSVATETVISPGTVIASGGNLSSPHGQALLSMQTGGNLVLTLSSVTIWQSGTSSAGSYAILQDDGNFVVYSSSNVAQWANGQNGNPYAVMYLQDSGAFIERSSSGVLLWQAPGTPAISTAYNWTANEVTLTGVTRGWDNTTPAPHLASSGATGEFDLTNYFGAPGWSQILDINRCPSYALPWLGQFVGVDLTKTPDLTYEQSVQKILSRPGFERGTVASLQSALAAFINDSIPSNATPVNTSQILCLENTAPLAPSAATLNSSSFDAVMASLSPLGWWKAADAVSSTTAIDSSGNGHTGTVTGTVTFGETGPIAALSADTAVLFNGSTGGIDCGVMSPLISNTPASIAGWCYFPTTNSNYGGAFGFRETSGGANMFYVSQLVGGSSNELEIRYGNSSGTFQTVNPIITTNQWVHIVATYDGTYLRAYVDGALSGITGVIGGYYSSTLGHMALGYQPQPTSPSNFFSGEVANVGVFNYALSAQQVTALYTSTANPPTTITTGVGGLGFSPTIVLANTNSAWNTLGTNSSFVIQIDSEKILVPQGVYNWSAGPVPLINASRGYGGTTPATHSAGATVSLVSSSSLYGYNQYGITLLVPATYFNIYTYNSLLVAAGGSGITYATMDSFIAGLGVSNQYNNLNSSALPSAANSFSNYVYSQRPAGIEVYVGAY
jgi:hypothetical protein